MGYRFTAKTISGVDFVGEWRSMAWRGAAERSAAEEACNRALHLLVLLEILGSRPVLLLPIPHKADQLETFSEQISKEPVCLLVVRRPGRLTVRACRL